MTDNKTLLQQVREKELAINTRLYQATRDTEQLVADAKKECAGIMNKADMDGRDAALAYFDGEKAKIDDEVKAIRLSYSKKVADIHERANGNMSAAVDMIIKEVTMQ